MDLNTIHILNGDALLHQLPDHIPGERIVTKECLVDGDVSGETLDDLFQTRASFIAKNYSGNTEEDYFEEVVPMFAKMLLIEKGSEVNLWFEDDLFCQVNLWFVCSLLVDKADICDIFLVRPEVHTKYGFGGVAPEKLPLLLENRISISEAHTSLLARLWKCYQENDLEAMTDLAKELNPTFPFILDAVQAHTDRVTNNKPEKIIKEIIEENDSATFGEVFQKFNEQAFIYGFGDLQVKRIYDSIKN